jgi:cilia- and flagella-associated protein 52
MEHSFKEHKKEVTTIRISAADDLAVSSSADGSCLVWSLRRATRINALFAPTVFRSVMFHPDESQLLTAGSDRKITYWDTSDCTAIRVMEGSTDEVCACISYSSCASPTNTHNLSGGRPPPLPNNNHYLEQIMTLDAERSGALFASGGQDRLVKVWRYDEGEIVATGSGHSGAVNQVRVAPDNAILVSVGEEGAVFIWKMPAP